MTSRERPVDEPTPEQMAAFRVALIAMSHAAQDMRVALDAMGPAIKDMADCMAWINKRERAERGAR